MVPSKEKANRQQSFVRPRLSSWESSGPLNRGNSHHKVLQQTKAPALGTPGTTKILSISRLGCAAKVDSTTLYTIVIISSNSKTGRLAMTWIRPSRGVQGSLRIVRLLIISADRRRIWLIKAIIKTTLLTITLIEDNKAFNLSIISLRSSSFELRQKVFMTNRISLRHSSNNSNSSSQKDLHHGNLPISSSNQITAPLASPISTLTVNSSHLRNNLLERTIILWWLKQLHILSPRIKHLCQWDSLWTGPSRKDLTQKSRINSTVYCA